MRSGEIKIMTSLSITKTMTNDDKINALEYFTKRHFATHQLVDYGLVDYFSMLRRNENAEFLDNLNTHEDLMEYSSVVRDTHQQRVYKKECVYPKLRSVIPESPPCIRNTPKPPMSPFEEVDPNTTVLFDLHNLKKNKNKADDFNYLC